jgi:hypothetical protein
LNKIDIVGFFSQKKTRGDLGLIEVKDFISFAVKFNKVKTYCTTLRKKNEGKKFKLSG